MRAASSTRYDRSAPRPGAVLVLLLATLLHLFGCCHGPTASPDARADALAQTSATACGQLPANRPGVTAAGQRAPAPDGEAHCSGLDQPTVQPREAGTGAPLLAAVPPAAPGYLHFFAPPARHRFDPRPPAPPAAETRAQLGVWRT
ncbi:hypothetical protein ACFYMX_16955 [Streptomyces griseofuscus]|uniref:hypothetical protein n=1 Tax=Streptomyces TaxID=1883 RepID=UPI0018F0F6F7|nr:hypothetical protein [Streptomyces sp. CRPSP2-6A1]MBJ7005158.1 hypothetical protein [Streptomyces sp. CRPSP2-6A1]